MFTNRKLVLPFIMILTFVVSAGANYCRCSRQHHQKYYCNAKHVFGGCFKKMNPDWNGKKNSYTFEIKELFKTDPTEVHLKIGDFVEVCMPKLCSINVKFYDRVLIYADVINGKLETDLCRGTQLYYRLSSSIKLGLRYNYERWCNCASWMTSYFPSLDCEFEYSYAKKTNNVCIWVKTYPYKLCRNGYRVK